jgi:hypothetical protein
MTFITVPTDLLEALAATATGDKPQPQAIRHANGTAFDIDAFMARHYPDVKSSPWEGGRRWVLPVCPINPEHTDRSAAIVQFPSGAVEFKCHHDGCSGKKWHDVRDVKEPGWQNRPSKNGKAAPAPAAVAIGECLYCTDKGGNYGTVNEDHGTSCNMHFISKDGTTADVEIDKSQLRRQDGSPLVPPTIHVDVLRASALLAAHPKLRPSIIDGLARKGETINIVSVSKVGKSWLGYTLLLSVAVGWRWLQRFSCEKGRVLLIDNELHRETLARRLSTTAEAMGLTDTDWRESVDIISLRGQLVDWYGLSDVIHQLQPNTYKFALADAFYRFLPKGVDENSNAEIAGIYNLIDNYTEYLGAVWCNIHHTSKGDQSQKSITDVGAGAGSQSRAADCHLILRPHEEDNVVVLEAVVRSFAPVKPLAIRWEYPLWTAADEIDPRRLRQSQTAKKQQQQAEDEGAISEIVAILTAENTVTVRKLRSATGWGKTRCERLLDIMQSAGKVIQSDTVVAGNKCHEYRLPDPQIDIPPMADTQSTLDFKT